VDCHRQIHRKKTLAMLILEAADRTELVYKRRAKQTILWMRRERRRIITEKVRQDRRRYYMC